MKSQLLSDAGSSGARIYLLVFDIGDEFTAGLTQFAREFDIHGASFTAIGALERCTLGWLDWQTKKYVPIPVNEQCEVAALLGDIGTKDGQPAYHAHMVVGTKGGVAHAGHVLEAWVRPTLEVIVTETPAHLIRDLNNSVGLPLLDISKSERVDDPD